MSAWFEELDYRRTPMGELVLQRRRFAALGGVEAFEVKLGENYLMSSLFHEAEEQLAQLGLGGLAGSGWEVVVGGLGLGYTAVAALRFPQVKRLLVIEALEPVIDWHRQGLVPNGPILTGDPRCVFRCADFFTLADEAGFEPDPDGDKKAHGCQRRPADEEGGGHGCQGRPADEEGGGHGCQGRPADEQGVRFDAVLLDIDHTPTHVLAPAHAAWYAEAGLQRLKRSLKPGGVFGLWSNDEPDATFLALLKRVFGRAEGHVIRFDNPLRQTTESNGLYMAHVEPATPQGAV